MNRFARKESHVLKEFNEIFKICLKLSFKKGYYICSHEIETRDSVGNDTQCSEYNMAVRQTSGLKDFISINRESVDWKSFNSALDSCSDNDIINEVAMEHRSANDLLQFKKEDEDFQKESEPMLKRKSWSATCRVVGISHFLYNINFKASHVPFETTDITNLSFSLSIIMENDEKFCVNVCNSFTIAKVIAKMSKKKSISRRTIALYYKRTRLESHVTLSWYNINSKSHVYLKILQKTQFNGEYLDTSYPITIYTSEKIIDIKEILSRKLLISPELIELKYRAITLIDKKEFFLYNINPGSRINIKRKRLNAWLDISGQVSFDKNPGFEISQCWQRMTSELKNCNCKEKRLDAMANGILSVLDDNYKNHKSLSFLSEFAPNLHHKSCFKSKEEITTTSFSSKPNVNKNLLSSTDDVKLVHLINSEIQKIEKSEAMIIEETDLDYLCYAKNFRAYKQFLREKIGTKCSLRSIAMLYNYAQKLVKFIDSKEENSLQVNRVLLYTKRYFLKYFEKDIIVKEGLEGRTSDTSQNFLEMTKDLKNCKCKKNRLNAMACRILSVFDKNYKNHKCLEILHEFSSNLHHVSCNKSHIVAVSADEINVGNKFECSLKVPQSSIANEIEIERKYDMIAIKEEDLQYLTNSKTFRTFKRYLRDQIGTKCTLRNIAMLCNYGQQLMNYINPQEEHNPLVNKMLGYTKRYFVKYFEKDLIKTGGMMTLVQSESDCDN